MSSFRAGIVRKLGEEHELAHQLAHLQQDLAGWLESAHGGAAQQQQRQEEGPRAAAPAAPAAGPAAPEQSSSSFVFSQPAVPGPTAPGPRPQSASATSLGAEPGILQPFSAAAAHSAPLPSLAPAAASPFAALASSPYAARSTGSSTHLSVVQPVAEAAAVQLGENRSSTSAGSESAGVEVMVVGAAAKVKKGGLLGKQSLSQAFKEKLRLFSSRSSSGMGKEGRLATQEQQEAPGRAPARAQEAPSPRKASPWSCMSLPPVEVEQQQ